MGAIDEIIEREGGFVDHPKDKGGPTKYGITQTVLEAWRGCPVKPTDVASITQAEAYMIYESEYLKKPGLDKVADAFLRAHLLDIAVLHGPDDAIKWLQMELGVKVDGDLGPKTLAALSACASVERLNDELVARRILYMVHLVDKNHSQVVFLVGWIARALGFLSCRRGG